MSEDDNILREYLLGTLPGKEAEQLDELSVTDADVSARLDAAEHDLIDSYAGGELSGIELQRFELHYLASPIRRQKLAFATAFREFGEKHQTPHEATLVASKPSIFAGLSPVFRWGFAIATLLLIVTASWLWLGRSRPQDVAVQRPELDQADPRSPLPSPTQEMQPQSEKNEVATANDNSETRNVNVPQTNRKADPNPENAVAPISIATFILAPPTRGQIRSITIPSGTSQARFTLELESSDFTKYSLTLRQQGDDRTVWQSGTVRSGRQAAVSVNIPAKLLPQNIYTFSVTGIPDKGTPEIIGDYTFRVMP